MDIDMLEYYEMLNNNNINIIYSGPIWGDGVLGISGAIKKIMEFDHLSRTASVSIFAVFVEQMNNMLLYSVEKVPCNEDTQADTSISRGVFIMGTEGNNYFLNSGNIIKNENIELLKSKIDLLNSLDTDGLKKLYKEQIRSDNNNPESKGAGIGLTEIARRASSKIFYSFRPYGEGLTFFSMKVVVNSQGEKIN